MSSDVPQRYGTILTAAGRQAVAAAVATATTVDIKCVALGDGGGAEYYPAEDQTDLKRQVYQDEANAVYIDPDNPNRIFVELAIPETAGGFTIREAAIRTGDQTVIAIGTNPSYYKPVLAEGAATAIAYRFILEVTNASVVALKIDSSLVYATVAYVNNAVANHVNQTNVHGGTYYNTPNRLALRNALGCTQVSDPVEELDAANRRWVWHMIQQHGIAPWRDSVTYDPLPWLVWGSDGMIYVALQPSGPGLANIGPKDPTATAGYWLAFTGYILNDAGFAEAVARTPKPAVLVAKTTAPQSLTNGAAQKIAFDTVSYDQTAFGAETGWDAGNNRWRCPQAGRWLVQYDPYIVYSGWSGTNFYNRIYKNGDMSTLVAGNAMGGGSGSGGPLSVGVYIFAALDMALGDYLECYNVFTGAGATTVAAGTSFRAVML